MKNEQTKNLLKSLEEVNVTLKTIGYESLFMIQGLDLDNSKNTAEVRDCLIRINNLSQKAHSKIEKQASTINVFCISALNNFETLRI